MKKLSILCLPFFILLSLTGCWSAKELTELTIAIAMGIDKSDEGYKVTVQVINPSQVGGNTSSNITPTVVYSAEGKNLFETLRRLTKTSPRKLYVAHLRIVLFGEELAREGIIKPLDFLSRDHEMRSDFLIAIAQGKTAEEQLKVLTPLEKLPANKIFSSMSHSEKSWAATKTVTLDELIASVTSEGKQPVLTGVKLIGNASAGNNIKNTEQPSPSASLEIGTLGVFKQDKLVDWFNEDESKGFNYLTDNVTGTVASVNCADEGTVGVEFIRSKTDVTGQIKEGKPKINVKIYTEANIGAVECKLDLSKTETIEKVEQQLEKKMKQIIMKSIAKAQDLESDVFGFGEVIARKDPKQWEKMKKEWDELFAELTVDVQSKIEIRRLGTTSESIQ